jgi:hypothetical protein
MYVWEPKQDTVKQGLEHNQTHVKAAIICSDMKQQICYRLIHIEKVDLACMLLYVQMKQKSEWACPYASITGKMPNHPGAVLVTIYAAVMVVTPHLGAWGHSSAKKK